MFGHDKKTMVSADRALPGRDEPLVVPETHFVNGNRIKPPFPDGTETLIVALGCFWGAERKFWETPGVVSTAVGYTAGYTPNPTYEEVCSGKTGHTEAVLVVYDPKRVRLDDLFKVFFESHDPTQGMAQGNDVGTQYRSGIYPKDEEQERAAEVAKNAYQKALDSAGHGKITTQIVDSGPFFYAEDYHQQYLAKNPNGYCGLGGTGVTCPIGLTSSDDS